MKVLIIAQYYPPDMGGGATRASNIAKGLSLAGVDVTVVTAFPHYPTGTIPKKYKSKILMIEKEGNINVMRTYVPGIPSKGIANRLLLFLSFVVSSLFAMPLVKQTDAIWAANPNIIAVFPSIIYKLKSKCPIFQNVDDLWPEVLYDLGMPYNSFFGKLAGVFARITYTSSSLITPVSNGYVDVICRNYGVNSEKVHVVRGGVDLSVFKPSSKPEPTKKFVVLYSGAFSVAYNFEQIFNAAKIIEAVDKDVEFVVQGAGELLSSMNDSVSKLGVKNVEIINKILTRAEVAELLGQADALILPLAPSFNSGKPYLGMSSKLYEYQAVGKPIICCSKGVPSTYVEETCSGLVVNPGDFEALAKAILELKQNPVLARTMGENGRKYVETEASIEAVGLRMKGILQQAIA